MKKTQVMITLVLVAVIVSASLIGTVSFAASTETHGAISIAFDDCMQSQYDYAFPLMQARGIKATFYVVTDHINDPYMSIAELQTLQDYGCEIASHSKTHANFLSLSDDEIRYECSVSKQVLQSYGFAAANFAYPYGTRNDHTDSIVSQYYRSARSAYVPPYIMQFPVSQFVLPGFAGETGDSNALPRLKSMVDQVYSTNGWAIIFFHNIIPDANNVPFTISSQDFESFLDYIVYRGVPTITVDQGLDRARVYLLLTVGSGQGAYLRGESVTFTVNVFNQLNPVLGSSLTLTVTGPSNYGYFDVQPISVPAGTVGEYSFCWVVPDVAGTYVVEVELVPPLLTAYDAIWLDAA